MLDSPVKQHNLDLDLSIDHAAAGALVPYNSAQPAKPRSK